MNCSNNPIFVWLGSIFGYVVNLFYNVFSNYGVAIILFTIFTRVIMFPLTIKQQKQMAGQQRLQPKLEQLKKQYGNNQAAYNQAMQDLYTKEGVSPTSGCLPMLIQFPLFFGMYEAIRKPLTCVLHISKDSIASLASMYGIDTAKSYYYEIDIINKIRNGILTAVTSASDVVSATSVSAADVVSQTNVVSASSVVSGADLISGSDVMGAVNAMTILGDSYQSVEKMCNSFNFLGLDLLQTAAFWNGALILAILVFIAQAGSMIVSNKINGITTGTPGCSPNLMAVGMGAFSMFIAFTIPAAFPLYWLTSSALAPVQTWITKKYFGPVIMNAKAEAQRNQRLKLEEAAIVESVSKKKGTIHLSPNENAKYDSVAEKKNNKSEKKKNGGQSGKGGKQNSGKNDYMGRKK